MKKIPNYIAGNLVTSSQEMAIEEQITVYNATDWNIISAIRNATVIQPLLKTIETTKIINVLENAMQYFNPSISLISAVLGSDTDFVQNSIEETKEWCKNISQFHHNIQPPKNTYHPTAPTVCILPGNSEQESLFVIAQVFLSKNAGIIRPSNRGTGAYTSLELIKAINRSIDDFHDPELEILKKAVSILSISIQSNYLQKLSVPGWNYILFGAQKSISTMKESITTNPRKIICYGTGLAMTIIWEDADLKKYIDDILASITTNGGNECVCTDIIYIHPSRYNEFIELFTQKAKVSTKAKQANIAFVQQSLKKRGLEHPLEINDGCIQPLYIPLTQYESAMEYPAPIVSIRQVEENIDALIAKDLEENLLNRNIVTSIYSENHFEELKKSSKAYLVKHNLPTHKVNLQIPHQGIYLTNELMDITFEQNE